MGMTDAQIDAKMDVVKPDDRGMVRDVLRVIEGIGCCSSYVITTAQKGYEVMGWINVEEVQFEQMELIQQVCFWGFLSCSQSTNFLSNHR